MWEYSQISGALSLNGQHVGYGFSGSRQGKNDPNFQNYIFGPIPRGRYHIAEVNGNGTMALEPADGNEAFGRFDFVIASCIGKNPGSIILAERVKKIVSLSPDKDLLVTK